MKNLILNNHFGKCVLAHWNCAFPGVIVSVCKENSVFLCVYATKCDNKGTQRKWKWNSPEMTGPDSMNQAS